MGDRQQESHPPQDAGALHQDPGHRRNRAAATRPLARLSSHTAAQAVLLTANTLQQRLSPFWANKEQLFRFPWDTTRCTAIYLYTHW